jgi:hypothetical protein
MAKKEEPAEITILNVETRSIPLYLVGDTPLIINRLSEKAKHELLMPKGRKTAAEKQSSLKHDPLKEFQASPHVFKGSNEPTLLGMPAAAPKRAIASAALDIPGAKKQQIGRLVWVSGEILSVYGQPKMFIKPVRSADMNHTPDIRTRCIIPNWVLFMNVTFVSPILRDKTVMSLVAASGLYIGIGDWRPEKGAGNYGQYHPMTEEAVKNDRKVKAILAEGRKQQEAAMLSPDFYDDESRELYEFYQHEFKERGYKEAA